MEAEDTVHQERAGGDTTGISDTTASDTSDTTDTRKRDTIGGMDSNDTVATTLRIDPDVYGKIRVLAAKEGKSASQWMREALALVVKKIEERDA